MENTTLLIGNMHCPSCVANITQLLTSPPLALPDSTISISLLTGLVTFSHPTKLLPRITSALTAAGFEVLGHQAPTPTSPLPTNQRSSKWYETKSARAKREEAERELERQRFAAHLKTCRACQGLDVGKGKEKECTVQMGDAGEGQFVTTVLVGGMTCASCVGTVERILAPEVDRRIKEVSVTLIPGKAVIRHAGISDKDLLEMIEDGGYEAEIVETTRVPETTPSGDVGWVESLLVIEGMTCSACVGSMNAILKPSDHPGARSAQVALLPPRAIVVHDPAILSIDKLVEMIEDGGYGAELVSSIPVDQKRAPPGERKVKLRVDGMFCDECSDSLNTLFKSLCATSTLSSFTPLSYSNPFTTISYTPHPPSGFTLRSLAATVASMGPFTIHPVRASDTLTTLSRISQAREARSILLRLSITFAFAIPTFVIAIVAMSLIPSSNPLRRYFETPIWGNASRATVALFAISTPVQFGVGSLFYQRAWKSLRGVWTRGGEGKWRDRAFRWGSMDSLVALGTTAGWAASVAFMAIDVRAGDDEMTMQRGGTMGYFDSSVFLMLFILAGRWLEGVSKRRTGDAVEALGKMKAVTGLLYSGHGVEVEVEDGERDEKKAISSDDGETASTILDSSPSSSTTHVTSVDFLEVGDTLLIPAGASVPLDSILLPSSSASSFDESSLTGEARPAVKSSGDNVFAGTTNLGPSAVVVRVEQHAGSTMLDEVVRAVGDAMARKAGIERIADRITGYFVPAIVGVAGITFGVWVVRGYAGGLPREWLDGAGENWALFAVQFAVAVLVVACPCGIGLAAPTAQLVGTGIAASKGIVPYGGGEAFQNATKIDCVVFDKTGTLTRGEFSVSAHHLFPSRTSSLPSAHSIFQVVAEVEESSAHPISIGLRTFCQSHSPPSSASVVQLLRSEEIPGRGLTATIVLGSVHFEVLVGNQHLIDEKDATYGAGERDVASSLAREWAGEGNSIVFVALRPRDPTAKPPPFVVAGLFAVNDPPRDEALVVIAELERQRIAVFLCTGDNRLTALAVAAKVGITPDRVFAGVLPIGKRDCIEQLQKGAAADAIAALRSSQGRWQRWTTRRQDRSRAKVLFVGDGINDIVALTQSDVGVSMGTGAAVALTSSDFCLLSSNLLSLITLLALARSTFDRILLNFAWALSFNTVLIPIAAGAFYDLGRTRLPPVWASLAMALSSVSVVSSSLLLRYTFRVPEVVTRHQPS